MRISTSERAQVEQGFAPFYIGAEDLAQEAFVRLLPRWSRVEAYADPDGWRRRGTTC